MQDFYNVKGVGWASCVHGRVSISGVKVFFDPKCPLWDLKDII